MSTENPKRSQVIREGSRTGTWCNAREKSLGVVKNGASQRSEYNFILVTHGSHVARFQNSVKLYFMNEARAYVTALCHGQATNSDTTRETEMTCSPCKLHRRW